MSAKGVAAGCAVLAIMIVPTSRQNVSAQRARGDGGVIHSLRSGIVEEGRGPRRPPDPGIRYPEALRASVSSLRVAKVPRNVNVMKNSDVVTQGTINGVTVQTCNPGKHAPHNEFTVAVNPGNPLNLVAGANDYRLYEASENRYDGSGGFYRSTDGGIKWTTGYLPGLVRGNIAAPGPYESAGDPSVAAGPNNVFWYANIAFNRSDAANSISVSRSADGGATWSTNYVIQTAASEGLSLFNDKDWIAAHPTNPNVAYVTWTQFAGASPIVYSATSDGGQTWSAPARVTNRFMNQGSVGVVDSKGRLHVVWMTTSNRTSLAYAARSGSSFGPTRVLSTVADPGDVTWAQFRTPDFPAIAIDGNTLHVVWSSWNGIDSDIVYIRSTNRGATWTKPVTICSDASDQFFPWIAAHGGLVAVSYLDHNGDTGSSYHASMVSSTDGGSSWSVSSKLSGKASDPSAGNLFQYPDCLPLFIGDYTGIALGSDGIAHPFWPDIRIGNSPDDPGTRADQDPYTAAVTIQP